jgi:hypothetical protein
MSAPLLFIVCLVLATAGVGLALWQIKMKPLGPVRWFAWSVFYGVLVGLMFSLPRSAVSPLWALAAGPLFASLQEVRWWVFRADSVRSQGPFASAFEIAQPEGSLVERFSVFAAAGVAAWALLWPRPYGLALLAAALAPWVTTALALIFRSQVAPAPEEQIDSRASLGVLIAAGCVALRVYADVHFSPSSILALWGMGLLAGGGLSLAWLGLSRRPFAAPRHALGICVFAMLNGVGSVAVLDVVLDSASGRPAPASADVCPVAHAGALGVGWRDLEPCSPQSKSRLTLRD